MHPSAMYRTCLSHNSRTCMHGLHKALALWLHARTGKHAAHKLLNAYTYTMVTREDSNHGLLLLYTLRVRAQVSGWLSSRAQHKALLKT